jgi:glycosyltransferase involved in cell wall biosynthesis
MRILYVTNDMPWPLTSGYLRHYHLIRQLSPRHQITLLSLVKRGHDPDDATALAPFTEAVMHVPATFGRAGLRNRVAARAQGVVVGGDIAASELGRLGATAHAAAPFDALLLSGKRTYPVLRSLPALPLVTDLCDATSSRIRRQLRVARPARLPALLVEYLEIRRVERALMARSEHVLFASVRDRDAIAGADRTAQAQTKSAVVPNGVDLAFWQRTSAALGPDSIVLTGAMDYAPNADAAVRLVTTILPIVQASYPTATAAIVGRDPTAEVQALADRPGVTVTGYVDDVRPYLDSAAVFAAPIRFGAGIQNKVLEAMAMEVPVVASPLAADGLRTEDGRIPPIDIAREPDDAAARIVAHLRAAEAGRQPAHDARHYVAEHFDWARSADRLDGLLEDAVGRGRGRSR